MVVQQLVPGTKTGSFTLVLKYMVAREHDIIDEEIQGIAGSLSSVTNYEQLWLAQVLICHNETKAVWTPVMVTGRLKQQ